MAEALFLNPTAVQLHDKAFELYLTEAQIAEAVKELAERMNQDYAGKRPLFLAVLNGSFMFASDLLKEINQVCEISFIKVSSYADMASTGLVSEVIGLKENIEGRHLIILEDIIDTGNTVQSLLQSLKLKNPASIELAALLLKPESLQHQLDIKYAAMEIPNDFVVGYGLDYNGLGRNLKAIYKLKTS